MTHIVTVTVATASESFPAGTSSSGIQVTLEGFAPVVLTAAPFVATFADVPAGATYGVAAQTLDGAGVALGSAVTGSVDIPTDAPVTVNLDVPTGLSISVA
jgi:hypothetical protein